MRHLCLMCRTAFDGFHKYKPCRQALLLSFPNYVGLPPYVTLNDNCPYDNHGKIIGSDKPIICLEKENNRFTDLETIMKEFR